MTVCWLSCQRLISDCRQLKISSLLSKPKQCNTVLGRNHLRSRLLPYNTFENNCSQNYGTSIGFNCIASKNLYVKIDPYLTLDKSVFNNNNGIGGSRGRTPRAPPPPLKVPILSFWHTKFFKCNHLGSPHPPTRSTPPPLREILDPPLNSLSFSSFFACWVNNLS